VSAERLNASAPESVRRAFLPLLTGNWDVESAVTGRVVGLVDSAAAGPTPVNDSADAAVWVLSAVQTIWWEVMQLARESYEAVHAAALCAGESGLAIVGPSGCGKTTLALALLLAQPRKWTAWAAEDCLLLDPASGAALPFPKPFRVKESAAEVLRKLGLQLNPKSFVPEDPHGRVCLVMPDEVPCKPRLEPFPVRWILFPEYTAGGTPAKLQLLSPSEAVLRLLKSTYRPDCDWERCLSTMSAVVNRAEKYASVHYAVLGQALQAVGKWLNEG